jgi:superfamily I DNA and RNA helicase
MTPPQRAAVNEPNPIALSGGPGTGKSFVSLWRHINRHSQENPIRSQLLTFTTSLAYYLQLGSASQNANAANFVDSINNWYYNNAGKRDEIIVDEAQDKPLEFYKNSNKLRKYSNNISYGADDKQILQPSAKQQDGSFNISVCSPENELHRIFNNRRFSLDRNFRNTKSILWFAKYNFPEAYIPYGELESCRENGEKPIFYITNGDMQKQNQKIIDIIRSLKEDEHNIGILTPLANPPRDRGNGQYLTAHYYFDLFKEHQFDCSYYDYTQHNGQGLTKMKNIHITPFKSAKGLEFDTVVIPYFDAYLQSFNLISWRDFFVAITRAKSNLFIFSSIDMPFLNPVINKQIL